MSRLLEEGDDVIAQFDACAKERPSVLKHPILVGTRHEIAAVFPDGCLRVEKEGFNVTGALRPRGLLTLLFEDPDVHSASWAVAPGQGVGLHHEGRLVTDHATEMVQLAPQIRSGLGLIGIRPEDEREVLALLRCAGVKYEKGQEVERS